MPLYADSLVCVFFTDMLFTGDVTPAINMAVKPEHFPPRLMLVLSERWYPHVVREGFNTAAYYLNM